MKKKHLNSGCPFGFLSTKHFSAVASAPNMKHARATNAVIRGILTDFVRALKDYDRSWDRVPLSAFDQIAKSSSTIHSNTPSSFEEIFPISPQRSAEHILSELQNSPEPLMRLIMKMHDCAYQNTHSHRKAATSVLKVMRAALEGQNRLSDDFFKAATLGAGTLDLQALLPVQGKDADISEGIVISPALKQALIAYQNIQERFESAEQIERVNKFLSERPSMMEDILGIQEKLSMCIQDQVHKNPEMIKYTRAFSEVVLFPIDGARYFFPSSRFLKITLHNWGAYFLEATNSSNKDILAYAADSAAKDNIYLQNIFMFREEDGETRLHGIKPVVCPASEAVGQMVSHFVKPVAVCPHKPEVEGVRYG